MKGLALVAVLLCPAALAGAPSPMDEIRQCISANLPRAARIQTIEVTSWDRGGGERTLKGRVFAARDRDQPRLMARVDFPRDVAGTSVLVREADPKTEVYIYLPSYKRVRRLYGTSTAGKLWGTDFSYDEFRRISNAFTDTDLELAGAGQYEGREVHVLTLKARPELQQREAIRVLVDRLTCVPLQAEFENAGAVRKRMTVPVAALRKAGQAWYAGEMLLQDLLANTRTRLRVLGITPTDTLSPGYFNPALFPTAH
jgi:hypothetical protein